jgi:hypothetical protein
LAFLIFSSSPYEVVYCTPAKTIAPTANSAPNLRNPFTIVTSFSLNHAEPEDHDVILIALSDASH